MAALVRKGVHRKPWVIWLPRGEELMIGKNYFPPLSEGMNVLPKHAILYSNNTGSWFIKDTSTVHGVFVNSKKIPKGGICEIHNEDSIGLGISEGTCEAEFEFTFCVNLARKVHGQVNARYADSEQRYLPVSPKECNYENCSTLNNESCNDSISEEVVIVEEFSNSHILDNDSSSDTISNSGSCIFYLTDQDDDSQQETKKVMTETNSLSLLSRILTSNPSVGGKIQEIMKSNEIQGKEVNQDPINGPKETVPENTCNSEVTPHHQERCISEKGDNQPVVDKNKSEEEVERKMENAEVVHNDDGMSNLNSIQDLDNSAEQNLCNSVNEKNSDDLTHIHTSDIVTTPNKKAQKKKNASKSRKRCYLFTRKKKKNNKAKTLSPAKCKLLQENITSDDMIIKKHHYIRSCYVGLQQLNVDLIHGRYIIPKCSSTDSGRNVQLEHPDRQTGGLMKSDTEEANNTMEKPNIFSEPKLNDQIKKSKTSAIHKRTNGYSLKRKILYPEGKYTKLMRNYVLLKRLESVSFKSSERCKKIPINNQNPTNGNTAVAKCDAIVCSNKVEPSHQEVKNKTDQVNDKKIPQEGSTVAVSVIKTKEVPKHVPNGINKKAAPKLPLVKNKAPKHTNSVPGSNAAGNSCHSNSKKFVIPKKKTVSVVDPCQNNVTSKDSSQKSERKTVNQKTSESRAKNTKSELSAYTIPKRKKSADDNVEVKRVCTTYDTAEPHPEKSLPSKSAYGNNFNKRGGATRRLSEGDSHGGMKRNDDFSSSSFPNKRCVARRDMPRRDFESHQSPNSFVGTNSPYSNTPLLDKVHENKYLTSPSDNFCHSPMSREENVLSFMQMNHVNMLANADPSVMRYSSLTSPPIHKNSSNNIPFVPQFPDQMQTKVNVLDPRVFRVERSNSLPTYNGIGLDNYQTLNDQVQDMELCEPDGTNYLVDCAKSYSSNSTLNDNRYLFPPDQNIACSVGMVLPANSSYDQLANISHVQDSTAVTLEVHEKNSSNDYPMSAPLRIPSPPVLSELITTSFTLESVLQQILSWNVNWLQEQRTSSRPPPVTIGSVKKLQLSYFTFDDYVLSFLQLILLETWQLLFTSWSHSRKEEALHFIIVNSNEENGSIVLDCQTVTTSIEVPNFPKEGKLLTFELMAKGGKISKIFGYILKHSVEKKPSSAISDELMSFHRTPASVSLLLVNFTVKIKKKEVNLFRDKLMQAHVIYYLKPNLHVIKSLLELPKSPLVKMILTPKKACCVVPPGGEKNLNVAGSYSAVQQALVLGICNAVMMRDPRIITVHGAPGTGKTHVILGILQQLLRVGRRVLITATSDAAVNEIGMRVRSLLHLQAFKDVNFILVGSPDKFPKDLLPFTLREVLKSVLDSYKQKIRRCQEFDADIQLEIEAFRQSVSDMAERSCPALEIKRMEQELHGKLRLQAANREELNFAVAEQKELIKNEKSSLRSQYLLSADVIVSTLNNSRQILLEDSSEERYSFACCIIDEATQSVEPELLQPLLFGMDKLILFGDKDLPPVIYSKASLDYNYELSLSGRIDSYFTDTGEGSPIVRLTEQYRMDPEICMFPSKFLYPKALTCVPQIKTSHFPVVPYIIFNSARLSKKFKDSGSPALEEILVKLCKDLVRALGAKHTIGIILPSNEQQKSLSKVLSRHIDTIKNIEINIVDFFQGQEKDVIILPCSTSNGENCGKGYLAHKHKLAISLTRAKRSLIVLGNFETMIFDSNMEQLISDAKQRGLCFDLDTAEEFSRYISNANFR